MVFAPGATFRGRQTMSSKIEIYVMQSGGISQKVEHVTFSVFFLIEILIRRGTFC